MKQQKLLCLVLLLGLLIFGAMFAFRQTSYTQEKSTAGKPNKSSNIIVRNTKEPGGFEIENKGAETDIDWQVMIERKENGEWKRLSKETNQTFLYVLARNNARR